MQFKTLALAFFVAMTTAQDVDPAVLELVGQIPACAMTCLQSGVADVGCTLLDFKCQCTNAATLTTKITPCVQSSCSAADALTATKISGEICVKVGVSAATGALNSATSALNSATSGLASITSSLGNVLSSATSTTAAPTTSATRNAVARAEAGMGLMGAAAFVALAL